MKLFECQNCGQLIYFENSRCERCGMALGYDHDRKIIIALKEDGSGALRVLSGSQKPFYYCANALQNHCNWLVPDATHLCQACNLNKTIPNLTVPENLDRWRRIEIAKRRLVYSLDRLGLPLENKLQNPEGGLELNFLADEAKKQDKPVLTGHHHGTITLNIIEADDAERTRIRQAMGEPYRTVLGHFRHEIAHYYFERIVQNTKWHRLFRRVFGDESQDYGAALQRHYENGAPGNWQAHYITAYASCHAHEDWAETFAHYLHMIDTLETAYAFGLRVRPRAGQDDNLSASISFDPYGKQKFELILEAWFPLTFAVNSLNRSMGMEDLYPFVISPAVAKKLKTVHDIVDGYDARTGLRGKLKKALHSIGALAS